MASKLTSYVLLALFAGGVVLVVYLVTSGEILGTDAQLTPTSSQVALASSPAPSNTPTPTDTPSPEPTNTPTLTPTSVPPSNTPRPTSTKEVPEETTEGPGKVATGDPTKEATKEPTEEANEAVTEEPTSERPAEPTEIAASKNPKAVVIWDKGLNVRYGPGVDYDPPIGYLNKGDELEIIGHIGQWIRVVAPELGISGWVSAWHEYVEIINADLEDIPEAVMAPPPTLLEPPDKTNIGIPTRLDLVWKWDAVLGASDYFRVEIWNRYNDFGSPIDVAWIKGHSYKYDQVNEAYHPEYRWRITVINGIPAGEKDWSTPENLVWEPSNKFVLVSWESETRTLFIEPPRTGPSPPTLPSPPDEGEDDDEKGGGGSVPGG